MDTEQDIIIAAQNGNRFAFGQLVKLYQRSAYAAAYSFVGNREDALEMSQEAFVRAFRAMGRFDTQMPFYPWLYRIVRNVCLNYLKKKRRHGEVSLNSMMEKGFDVSTSEANPEECVATKDMQHAIAQAITQLSQEHQEILRLRHFQELSYAEIAACLDVPQGTVMSRLYAARKKLRRVIEEDTDVLANI